MFQRYLFLPCLTFMLASACGSNQTDSELPPGATFDFRATLKQTADGVILPTYLDLRDRAEALLLAVRAFETSSTEDKLEAARNAWLAARVPWEQSEGFLFGPVTDLGLDPWLDSWPVDRVQLDWVLESKLELSAESINTNFGGNLRGFHTIEYLLWGVNHVKTAADLAERPRELGYLVASTEALKQDTAALYDAWSGEDGYAASFTKAGSSGGIFFSQSDAVQQLVNGMIEICDEVANGKIADPFKAKDRTLVESQFAYNSINDFSDDIRSVKNVYQGSLEGKVKDSLSSFVEGIDPALDRRLNEEIDAAIATILAISADGQPFALAITDPTKSTAIEAAQESIRTVMNTLTDEVLGLIVQ